MVGGEGEKRAQKRKTKGEGKERQRRELGVARSVLGEVRRIINEISKFSGHCGGMGSCRHTPGPCGTSSQSTTCCETDISCVSRTPRIEEKNFT